MRGLTRSPPEFSTELIFPPDFLERKKYWRERIPWTPYLHQGPNHHIEAVLHQGTNHNQATPSSVPLQGLNRATPSSVWPSDLITILQRIAATPCRQPSKPFFAFEFSLEAANKNFILLKRKFGGDLSKALLAQSNSPLGYGSEFKPSKRSS